MKQTKFRRFERIKKQMVTLVITVICVFTTYYFCSQCYGKAYYKPNIENIDSIDTIYNSSIEEDTIINKDIMRDSIKQLIIDEVQSYIGTKTKDCNNFIPKYLVHAGLTNDIDICFMMAQTQVETCYGTLGAGREVSRRSLFGVAGRKYSSYEMAIDHYCLVLKRYYLTKGRTEQHLLAKYVTHTGARYAENPQYERDLNAAYKHIAKNTQIQRLQQEYKNIG